MKEWIRERRSLQMFRKIPTFKVATLDLGSKIGQ
jgi:hypothetical protein